MKSTDNISSTATKIKRRTLLGGAATAAIVFAQTAFGKVIQRAIPESMLVTDDPTKMQGIPPSVLGSRSPFEQPLRKPSETSSRTPLQDLYGTLTPSDLHYERHHAGVPAIDPEKYELLIHGMVEKPMIFTLSDLKRFPAVLRICFFRMFRQFQRRQRNTYTPGNMRTYQPE
jgi:sulfane dehydrogenase subunit SoxC